MTPLLHVHLLCLELLVVVVVVRLLIAAKDNCLANKVKRVRAAAEASVSSVEVVRVGERGDCSIVVCSIVEDEVAEFITPNTVFLERLFNCISDSITSMRACEMWEGDREILYHSRGVSKVCNDSKESTLATLCRPTIKAYVDLACSF